MNGEDRPNIYEGFDEDEVFAFRHGYEDGYEQGREFNNGQTWTEEDCENFAAMNEAYDYGVNVGQARRAWEGSAS